MDQLIEDNINNERSESEVMEEFELKVFDEESFIQILYDFYNHQNSGNLEDFFKKKTTTDFFQDLARKAVQSTSINDETDTPVSIDFSKHQSEMDEAFSKQSLAIKEVQSKIDNEEYIDFKLRFRQWRDSAAWHAMKTVLDEMNDAGERVHLQQKDVIIISIKKTSENILSELSSKIKKLIPEDNSLPAKWDKSELKPLRFKVKNGKLVKYDSEPYSEDMVITAEAAIGPLQSRVNSDTMDTIVNEDIVDDSDLSPQYQPRIDAVEKQRDSLEVVWALTKIEKPSHFAVFKNPFDLGVEQCIEGNNSEAVETLGRVAIHYEARFGPDHPSTRNARSWQAYAAGRLTVQGLRNALVFKDEVRVLRDVANQGIQILGSDGSDLSPDHPAARNARSWQAYVNGQLTAQELRNALVYWNEE